MSKTYPVSESAARELPRRDYDRLKLGTVDLVDVCGGARRAEQHTRVSHQQLGSYLSSDEKFTGTFMPIDIVADLEADAAARGHRPLVTEILAELAGYRLIRMPQVLAAETDEQGLLKVAKETTEAIATGWAARADGRVTEAERAEEITQIDEAVVALLELRERLLGDRAC